jgi:hypothetical protein
MPVIKALERVRQMVRNAAAHIAQAGHVVRFGRIPTRDDDTYIDAPPVLEHEISKDGKITIGGTEVYAHMPVVPEIEWGDTKVPSRWHSCSKMSRRGRTRMRGKNTKVPSEVCPCGGWRLRIPGEPPHTWADKNKRRA